MTTLVTQPTIDPVLFASLANTTSNQTLANKTLKAVKEPVTIINTAGPSGTINFDVATSTIMMYNNEPTGNFSLFVRGDANTNFASMLGIGESLGLCLLVRNGSNTGTLTSVSIQGSTGISTQYQSGVPFTVANTSATNMYNIFIIKSNTNSYNVYMALTKYA
jgi:hypothetical protein